MNKRKEIIRTLKFTLISISAAVVQFASFALLYEVLHISEGISNTVALILSVIWNFTINRKVTFKSANNIKIAMLLVVCFYLVFTPLSSILISILVEAGVNGLVAEIIIMLINFVLEFLYNRFIVYRNSCDTIDEKSE